mgnify:CR=1 FL=1
MLLVFLPIYIWADEGMWLPCCLSKQTQQVMKDMGLNLTPRQLYNPGGAALSNAVVSFGGFCSGVVVRMVWCSPIIIVVSMLSGSIAR